MKKVLETNRVLTTFEGEPMRLGDKAERPARLGDVLLIYLRNAGQMGLSEMEQSVAYAAGMKIGQAQEGERIDSSDLMSEATEPSGLA